MKVFRADFVLGHGFEGQSKPTERDFVVRPCIERRSKTEPALAEQVLDRGSVRFPALCLADLFE